MAGSPVFPISATWLSSWRGGNGAVTVFGVSTHEHSVEIVTAASFFRADHIDATAFAELVLLLVLLLVVLLNDEPFLVVLGTQLSFAAANIVVVKTTVEVTIKAGRLVVFAAMG